MREKDSFFALSFVLSEVVAELFGQCFPQPLPLLWCRTKKPHNFPHNFEKIYLNFLFVLLFAGGLDLINAVPLKKRRKKLKGKKCFHPASCVGI